MDYGTFRRLHDGRWLLHRRRRRLLLPEALGRRLATGDDDEQFAALLMAGDGSSRSQPGLTVLPAALVRHLSRFLVRGVSWPGLAAGLCLGVVCLAWGMAVAPRGQVSWPWIIALLLCGGMIHELGHAAALIRGGAAPGGIGLGLLTVFPVLWCDVTEVVLLERGDRLRVDFAGPVWQFALAGALAAAARLCGERTLHLVAQGSLLAVTWSLLPLPRTDGAWALADLTGIAGMTAPAPQEFTQRRLGAVAAGRILAAIALAAVSVAVPWRLGPRLSFMYSGPASVDVLATFGITILLTLVLISAARRVRSLLRAAAADLRQKKRAPAAGGPFSV